MRIELDSKRNATKNGDDRYVTPLFCLASSTVTERLVFAGHGACTHSFLVPKPSSVTNLEKVVPCMMVVPVRKACNME